MMVPRRERSVHISISLFSPHYFLGYFHPSNYLRCFIWNIGTHRSFLPSLHFQDTSYNHGLEYVINVNKYRIKSHKIEYFFLHWPWPCFVSHLLLIVCWLPSIICVKIIKEEGTAININTRLRFADDGGDWGEAIVSKSSKLINSW